MTFFRCFKNLKNIKTKNFFVRYKNYINLTGSKSKTKSIKITSK